MAIEHNRHTKTYSTEREYYEYPYAIQHFDDMFEKEEIRKCVPIEDFSRFFDDDDKQYRAVPLELVIKHCPGSVLDDDDE